MIYAIGFLLAALTGWLVTWEYLSARRGQGTTSQRGIPMSQLPETAPAPSSAFTAEAERRRAVFERFLADMRAETTRAIRWGAISQPLPAGLGDEGAIDLLLYQCGYPDDSCPRRSER